MLNRLIFRKNEKNLRKCLSINHLQQNPGFFAVFSGISWSGLSTWCYGLFFNPKGIGSFSPALARFRERPNAGLPQGKVPTLKGLHINGL